MRKFKIVYYIIYASYIGTSVYFALDIEAMFKQFGMLSFLNFLKYWGAFGLLLLIVEWSVENIHLLKLRRKNKRLETEVVALKSEMYELNKKLNPTAPSSEVTANSLEKPNSQA